MDTIVVLQKEPDLTFPEELPFQYAQMILSAGFPQYKDRQVVEVIWCLLPCIWLYKPLRML